MDRQQQPVALVTGAGRGIGRAIALGLGAEGYAVAINDVVADEHNLEQGAYEVRKTLQDGGGRAEVFRADISNAGDRERMLAGIDAAFGRLDLLVNNAGVAPRERRDLLETTEESFDRLMAINLKGAFFLTQAAAQRMLAYRAAGLVPQPRIAFITSISAYTSSVTRGEYCISKAGLSMAALLFADRLAAESIPVLEVRPGIIDTEMISKVKEKYERLAAEGLLPQQRLGRPEDVGRVLRAFARGDLDYSTGETIEVGGGFHIRRL